MAPVRHCLELNLGFRFWARSRKSFSPKKLIPGTTARRNLPNEEGPFLLKAHQRLPIVCWTKPNSQRPPPGMRLRPAVPAGRMVEEQGRLGLDGVGVRSGKRVETIESMSTRGTP